MQDTPETTPSVLVAEDDELSRMAATRILTDLGYRVIAVGTLEAGLQAVQTNPIDLAVVDLSLRRASEARPHPDSTNGLLLIDQIRVHFPFAGVMIWTAYIDKLPSPIELLRRCGSGGIACVVKGGPAQEFIDAIKHAKDGGVQIPALQYPQTNLPRTDERFIDALQPSAAALVRATAERITNLTPRERQIVQLIGSPSHEIAIKIKGMQPTAVDRARSDIYAKLLLTGDPIAEQLGRRTVVLLAHLLRQVRGDDK